MVSLLQIVSCVCGIPTYEHFWETTGGQVLLLEHEKDMTEDKFAVAIVNSCRACTKEIVVSQMIVTINKRVA